MKHTTPILLEEELADIFLKLPKAPEWLKNIFIAFAKISTVGTLIFTGLYLLYIIVTGSSQITLSVPFTDVNGGSSVFKYGLIPPQQAINFGNLTFVSIIRLLSFVGTVIILGYFITSIVRLTRKGWIGLFIYYLFGFTCAVLVNDVAGTLNYLIGTYFLYQVRDKMVI